jgi:nicotinamidase/pyrazinamidase
MSGASDPSLGVRSLIVVDVQNDFCEGGSLGVSGGAEVARRVTCYLAQCGVDYRSVVASRDWHVDPGGHFSSYPDFVRTWPAHCVAGTDGAAFHPGLEMSRVHAVVSKGAYESAYSAFEGSDDGGRPLRRVLLEHGVTGVDVVGIATDYCVRATALDAARAGFHTRVFVDLCVGVNPETTAAALAELAAAGVELPTALDVATPER